MFRNYITVALRHMSRRNGYAFINTMSLALGIACCLLILLYIRDELSYDRFHDKADRIYRVISEERQGGAIVRTAEVMTPTVRQMREDFPEVEDMVRFNPPVNAWMVKYGDRGFYERNFYLADATVFSVFDVPLLKGNPRTALSGNDKVVLSETVARKYFGDEDPMGKVMDAEGTFHFEVAGVMADLPSNTHLGFDILASFGMHEAFANLPLDAWGWRKSYSYILLRDGSDPAELEARLPVFVEKYVGDRYDGEASSLTFRLQPVTDIHLHSRLERELTPNSDIRYVYLFAAIAAFIILIACINFMNLATARSAGRAREIGLRKVFGAGRGQVIRQYLSESLVMSGLGVCVALLLVVLTLPWFSVVSGKSISLDAGTTWFILGAVAVTGIVVGLISGSYPALYLSGLAPIETLKGTLPGDSGNVGTRRTLVAGQFVISIALIICTGVVYGQLDYIRNRNLGMDTERLVAVPLTFTPVIEKARIYRQRVRESPFVADATATFILPFHRNAVIAAVVRRSGEDDGAKIELNQAWTDDMFADTFGIELAAGRFFDRAFVADWYGAGGGTVLNEAAVARLGYGSANEALGSHLDWVFDERHGFAEETAEIRSVVGVVKDFHYASLHEPIEPLVLFPESDGNHVVVRIADNRLSEGLSAIEEAWRVVNPDFAFEYFLVEDTYARLYETEQRFGRIFVSFAALAVFIACLGLFGLASFAAERRTKEIGVRKVLGASTRNLVGLLLNEFVRLVILANVFAWPLAYVAMSRWLDNFAYRIDLGWTTFILAGALAMGIALVTVSYQAVRAAMANPIESLRTE